MNKKILTLMIMLGCVAMVAAFCGPAAAKVTGVCSDCHTMHNSQDGSPMAQDEEGNPTTPFAYLTLSSCIGCHATASGFSAPKIDGIYGTDATAGGTWRSADAGTDQKMHNVNVAIHALEADSIFFGADDIPGLTSGGMNSGKGSTLPEDLTCAGANGCHGNATIAGNLTGIAGFHHGSTEGYRYLQIASDQSPVSGLGSADWEAAQPDAGNHNVYSSDTSIGISKFCDNCHPNFHGPEDTYVYVNSYLDYWIRHPTDQDIPAGWSPNTTPADLYSEHPFAFEDLDSKSTTSAYDETDAQVMCLSCHRAHGSPYDDILRWNYDNQCAGSATTDYGCLGCHDAQRG